MKIRNLFQLSSALLLSLSALLTISIPLAHAAPEVCTWQGGGGNNNIGNSLNWSGCGSGVDQTGGDTYTLIFPSGASSLTPVIDASYSVSDIIFSGSGYILSSNSNSNTLTVSDGITDNSAAGTSNEINANISFTGSSSNITSTNNQLIVGQGADTVAAGTGNLTLADAQINDPITGSGSLIVNDANYPATSAGVDLSAANAGFTGSVAVSKGVLFVDDAAGLTQASSVTVASGALLKGNGGISTGTIQSGGTVAPGYSPGCLSAGSLTINGTYAAELTGGSDDGATACTDYDQLQVSNSVNLTGATLQLSLSGLTPSAGQSFTIIDNQGSNPVTGTFAGLPEGATFVVGGNTFQITYQGGDGNDVVVTVVTPATSADATAPGSPDTGLAAFVGNPWESLLAAGAAALALMGVARRLKQQE